MTASIDIDLNVVDDELNEVEARLEKLEADPVEIDIEVDDGELHEAAAKAEMLDGRDLDLETNWEDDGLQEAIREWNDLQRSGGSHQDFSTTRTEKTNVYFNDLAKEERERLDEIRSMEDREVEMEVQAAIEEESLASTEAALNRLARDREVELDTDWNDDGLRETLDELNEAADRGRYTSITTDRTHRTTYDGLSEEEWDKLDRLDSRSDKEIESEIKATVDAESLVSTEAALNRVARDRTTEIEVDHDAVGSFIAEPLDLPSKDGGGGTTMPDGGGADWDGDHIIEYNGNIESAFDPTEDEIPGGKSRPGQLTWGQLADLGNNKRRRLNIEKAEVEKWELDPEGEVTDHTRRGMSDFEKRGYRRYGYQNADSFRERVDMFTDFLSSEWGDNDNLRGGSGDFDSPFEMWERDKRNILSMSTLGDDGLLNKMSRSSDRLIEKLKSKLIPSMSTLYSLFAALSPVIAAVAVNLAGVAGAMGAVAGAGALLVGGGLLGHAQSMEEATAQAQERVQDLKKDLFEAFQPAFQAFAPISERILSKLPMYARDFAQELEGLTVFEDIVDSGIEGVFDFLANATEVVVEHSEEIEQLSTRFGSLFADLALDGLEWLIEEAYANQDLLERLITSLVLIGKILYNVAEFIARAMSHFNGLFRLLAAGAELLSGSWLSSVLSFVTGLAMLGKAAGGLASIFTWLFRAFAVAKIARAAGAVYGLISAVWALNSSLAVTAGLMSAITLGAAAVAGGMAYMSNRPDPDVPNAGRGGAGGQTMTPGFSPTGPGSEGGGTKQVNINMYGDVREQDMARLERRTREVIRDEEGIGQHRNQTGQPGDGERR